MAASVPKIIIELVKLVKFLILNVDWIWLCIYVHTYTYIYTYITYIYVYMKNCWFANFTTVQD